MVGVSGWALVATFGWGFNTAAGYGQQDAGRALQAAGMNQGANLQAASTNAANSLNAQQFNEFITRF